jgi:hypothetical protein
MTGQKFVCSNCGAVYWGCRELNWLPDTDCEKCKAHGSVSETLFSAKIAITDCCCIDDVPSQMVAQFDVVFGRNGKVIQDRVTNVTPLVF